MTESVENVSVANALHWPLWFCILVDIVISMTWHCSVRSSVLTACLACAGEPLPDREGMARPELPGRTGWSWPDRDSLAGQAIHQERPCHSLWRSWVMPGVCMWSACTHSWSWLAVRLVLDADWLIGLHNEKYYHWSLLLSSVGGWLPEEQHPPSVDFKEAILFLFSRHWELMATGHPSQG